MKLLSLTLILSIALFAFTSESKADSGSGFYISYSSGDRGVNYNANGFYQCGNYRLGCRRNYIHTHSVRYYNRAPSYRYGYGYGSGYGYNYRSRGYRHSRPYYRNYRYARPNYYGRGCYRR